MTGSGKMRNAEYRCGIGIALGLELGSGVRVRVMVMARAWVRVRERVLFCNSIMHFVAILRIPHCADAEWSMVLRLGLWLSLIHI